MRNYLIPVLTLLAIILFIWLFSRVVLYLLIAVVLSFLGQPLVKLFSKIRYKNMDLPDGLIAALTLAILSGIICCLFLIFVPVLISEVQFLSTLNFHEVFSSIVKQFPTIQALLNKLGTEKEISASVLSELGKHVNLDNISSTLNKLISLTGQLVAGTLAVLFITFFILRENKMVKQSLLLISPTAYEKEVEAIFRTSRFLLTKYFVGLFVDSLIVTVLVSSSMFLLGIKNALLIGIFTGMMNIIPYVGPLISFFFALLLGITGCIEVGQIEQIGGVITKIFFILLSMNVVDGFFIQPYIFSSSVRAHPLEIFLVILMAATVGGIFGMVIAIPTYTLLRVVAKEFLVNFKFFKKLSENIPE